MTIHTSQSINKSLNVKWINHSLKTEYNQSMNQIKQICTVERRQSTDLWQENDGLLLLHGGLKW